MSEFRDRIKDFRRVPAASLKPSPRNWRTHPAAQREALEAMLGRVGIADAAIARELPDGSLELIDGHLRADVLTGDVPVLVLDVDQAEADQLLATLDPLAGMAGTDGEKLNALLAGFAGGAGLDEMLDALREKADEAMPEPVFQSDPDEVPEVREAASARRGDLIVLGAHRLLCGDSTNADDVARLMDGANAALCATDPPYGVDYANVLGGRENQKAGGWREIGGDDLDDAGLEKLVHDALAFCDAPTLFCWHSWKRVEVFMRAIRACGWRPVSEIIWVKNALVFGRSDYQWRHESCIYAKRDGAPRQDDRTATTVWEFPKPTGGEHPTSKPTGLFEIPIRNHTTTGDVVYEPFSGSGSQLIAAEQLGRRCFGMEIDPIYVDVIVRRWQTFAGKKAEGWRGNT